MSREYDDYLTNHINNVQKGIDYLRYRYPDEIDALIDGRLWLIRQHDDSKYTEHEYHAYDDYFYGNNKSYEVVNRFKRAWLFHIHNNPHHWQYWVLLNDDEGEEILEIPTWYVVEMVCDWWSFSWKNKKLDEIFDWYEKHKDKMKLHPDTRKLAEKLLAMIKKSIAEDKSNGRI